MSFTTTHHDRLSAAATAVDCHKQVRSWRLLRTVLELLLPSCNCTFVEPQDRQETNRKRQNQHYKNHSPTKPTNFPSSVSSSATAANSSTFTGTIFSFRRAKVNFCIQSASKTLNPAILLLELAVPTNVLAREMRGGILRIALESNHTYSDRDILSPLLSTPSWNMYCNGRKVGFAIRREPSKAELAALRVLSTVTEGVGVVNGAEMNREDGDHMMYLRASFKRVFGSSESESFHLIDPRGNIGQELSIFFFRSPRR